MSLTHRGWLLCDVLCGRTVPGVSQAAMEDLCADLAHGSPARFCRAIPMHGGGYRVSLVGLPDAALMRALMRDEVKL